MRYVVLSIFLLAVAVASADETADEAAALRSATIERHFPRELPGAIPEARDYRWQAIAPKILKRSLAPPLPAEIKLEPRLAVADRGHVERHRPALEQLALGLNADPPRPQYPLLSAGPRTSGESMLAAGEVLKLPPLGRTTDAKLTLTGDPASVATRPYTAPLVTASRGSTPPRDEIGIPDPFVVRREAKLSSYPRDEDPPAPSFGAPERPMLPVEAKAK